MEHCLYLWVLADFCVVVWIVLAATIFEGQLG